MGNEAIIVVEDEADIRDVIEHNLCREGYTVCATPNGEDGLRLAQTTQPDLVLLDLMLPGLDGIEICRRLKTDSLTHSTPVMMVTAKADESDIVLGLGVGADDYVVKPFSPRELVARVRAILRRGPLKDSKADGQPAGQTPDSEADATSCTTQKPMISEEELERAQRIQANLIPRDVEIQGLDVAIGFEPCYWVGGDYADAVPMPDGRVLLIVCDVCGKGLQAALVTASLHSCVHMAVQSASPLSQLIYTLNAYLRDALREESFVTAIIAAVDCVTGKIEYANAGHPPAMIVDARGNVRCLRYRQNTPLGLLPTRLTTNHTVLNAGEMLAMFTDGCTELCGEQTRFLGLDGLAGCLARAYVAPDTHEITDVGRHLKRSFASHQGTAAPRDDLTFLLARVKEPSTAAPYAYGDPGASTRPMLITD